MLGRMVGGTWRTTGDFVAEFKYEWRVKGKAIRAVGVIARARRTSFPAEALYGWDPEARRSTIWISTVTRRSIRGWSR